MEPENPPIPATPATSGPPPTVEESKAQRTERLTSKFRDRGGIFVPTPRNDLLQILLNRPAGKRKSRSPTKPRSPIHAGKVLSPTKRAAVGTKRKGRQSVAAKPKATRKSKAKANDDVDQSAAGTSTPKTKPKATRKTKAKADDKVEGEEGKPPPKRRGRPPKAKVKTDASKPKGRKKLVGKVITIEVYDNDDEDNHPPPKRGSKGRVVPVLPEEVEVEEDPAPHRPKKLVSTLEVIAEEDENEEEREVITKGSRDKAALTGPGPSVADAINAANQTKPTRSRKKNGDDPQPSKKRPFDPTNEEDAQPEKKKPRAKPKPKPDEEDEDEEIPAAKKPKATRAKPKLDDGKKKRPPDPDFLAVEGPPSKRQKMVKEAPAPSKRGSRTRTKHSEGDSDDDRPLAPPSKSSGKGKGKQSMAVSDSDDDAPLLKDKKREALKLQAEEKSASKSSKPKSKPADPNDEPLSPKKAGKKKALPSPPDPDDDSDVPLVKARKRLSPHTQDDPPSKRHKLDLSAHEEKEKPSSLRRSPRKRSAKAALEEREETKPHRRGPPKKSDPEEGPSSQPKSCVAAEEPCPEKSKSRPKGGENLDHGSVKKRPRSDEEETGSRKKGKTIKNEKKQLRKHPDSPPRTKEEEAVDISSPKTTSLSKAKKEKPPARSKKKPPSSARVRALPKSVRDRIKHASHDHDEEQDDEIDFLS